MQRDLHKIYLESIDTATHEDQSYAPKIWAVGSGKGGVGKTFVSTSIAMTLSKLGHDVVIVDLDLSGANVHTSLGIPPSHLNIRHFFEHSKPLQELVIPTPYPHLNYVQGFWDSWTPTEYTKEQIESLMLELKNLRADYVILDMGPGAQEAHLSIFKHAHEKFLVTGPEPTSVEKTYRFIEAFVCYSLRENSTPEAYGNMISKLRDYRQRNLLKPFSFRSFVKETEGLHFDFFESLSKSPLRLIVNSARSQNDEALGAAMKSVCRKYFDLDIDYIAAIDFNNAVWQSILNKEHVLVAQPFTPLAGQFLTTCKQLIDPEELRAVV